MLTFDLSDVGGAVGLAAWSGAESSGCACASDLGAVWAASGLASGASGALPEDAFSLSPGGDSIFGSGFGAGGACSGFVASRGAGGGRGGAAIGDGLLRAVGADGGLGFVAAGADWGPYGLIALGMCRFDGAPYADFAAGPAFGTPGNEGGPGGG